MEFHCPSCGQLYNQAQAEAQGFLCPPCRTRLKPGAPLSIIEVSSLKTEQISNRLSLQILTYYCPSCEQTYSPEQVYHNPFCPSCEIPLETSPPSIVELRPGQEWQGRRGGRYRLDGVLGHGGQAQVWRAQVMVEPSGAKSAPKAVVLKIYQGQPERLDTLLDVYTALTSQNIPYVTPLLDYGQEGPWTFLVFPFYPQGHIRPAHFRNAQGTVNWSLLRQFVEQITEALRAVHSLKIVHRDLKPSNIFLKAEKQGRRFFLGDFGMATPHSISGFRGTLLYTPPEAFLWTFREGESGEGAVLPAWDWWSLGITLVEMITGQHPLQSVEPQNWGTIKHFLQHEFQRDRFVRSLGLPEEWEILLRGLLTRNPEIRWRHIQVQQWLQNPQSVPVTEEAHSLLVVSFRGRYYYTFEGLAWAAWDHWEAARAQFIQRTEWMKVAPLLPESRRERLHQMLAGRRDPDTQLAVFLWILNPELPLGLGSSNSWPTLEGLLKALAQESDPLVERLRSHELFSAYFAITQGRLYGLESRWQPEWTQILQDWEHNNHLRPMLLALWFSPEYLQQVRQETIKYVRDFLDVHLCSPEIEQELRQTIQEIARWDASQPHLEEWERHLRAVEQLPQQAIHQGHAISRNEAQELLEQASSRLQKLVEESVPKDESSLQWLLQAQKLWERLSSRCSRLTWDCWRLLELEILPFLQKLPADKLRLLRRAELEQGWHQSLTRAERFYQIYVPTDHEGLQLYQALGQALGQAARAGREIPSNLEAKLHRWNTWVEIEKLLDQIRQLEQRSWISREQALHLLSEFQQQWRIRERRILWPKGNVPPFSHIHQEIETWLHAEPSELSNEDLFRFQQFLRNRLRPVEHLLVTVDHQRIWQIGGTLFQVLLSWLLGFLLPGALSSAYSQKMALWQAWSWLLPWFSLLISGGYGLYVLRSYVRSFMTWRRIVRAFPFIWSILALGVWFFWSFLFTFSSIEGASLSSPEVVYLSFAVCSCWIPFYPLLLWLYREFFRNRIGCFTFYIIIAGAFMLPLLNYITAFLFLLVIPFSLYRVSRLYPSIIGWTLWLLTLLAAIILKPNSDWLLWVLSLILGLLTIGTNFIFLRSASILFYPEPQDLDHLQEGAPNE